MYLNSVISEAGQLAGILQKKIVSEQTASFIIANDLRHDEMIDPTTTIRALGRAFSDVETVGEKHSNGITFVGWVLCILAISTAIVGI